MRLDDDVERARILIHQINESEQVPNDMKTWVSSTYGRVVLGLAGYLDWSVDQMRVFLADLTWNTKDAERMAENLLVFAEAIRDEDNAIYIAKIGAHPLLVRLMEHDSELVQDAAAHVVSVCASTQSAVAGIAFPHRVCELGDVERAQIQTVMLPNDPRDATGSDPAVLIRRFPARMTGQPKTGYLLWGAAFVLAPWLHLHRECIDGKILLEVGSGLGLCGVVASRYAARTILTDYQDDTCRALAYNVALNRDFLACERNDKDVRLDADETVEILHLDWDDVESIRSAGKPIRVDVVMASDVICEPSTADGFLRVVRERLAPHGIAYLMNADAHSRFGVSYLHDALAHATDLVYSITRVEDLSDGAALLQGVPDALELHYEFYEIRLRQ